MAFNLRSWIPWGSNSNDSSSESSSPTSPTAVQTPPSAPPPTTTTTTLPESTRLRRQLTLLLAGSAFLALSIRTTHRSIRQRKFGMVPPYYHPNNRPPLVPVNGANEALAALNLATLNTLSFGMMLVGGGMFALDVCTLEELRGRVRAGEGDDGEGGRRRREAEEEFEEWIVEVLARKERKEEVKRMVERERIEREGRGGG